MCIVITRRFENCVGWSLHSLYTCVKKSQIDKTYGEHDSQFQFAERMILCATQTKFHSSLLF